MNYRHAYHAGNFGDVLKHVVLALVLDHLKQKPAPFFVLDTHAGRGVYSLRSVEAGKTGEWRDGVGRLWAARPATPAGDALKPWLDVIEGLNPDGRLTRYPGSPELVARIKRPIDRAVFVERHPEEARALTRRFVAAERISVLEGDGWRAVARHLPPLERRGLVLIDPPFEEAPDFVRLSAALKDGVRRFATGTYLLWYPVKGTDDVKGLISAAAALAIPKTLRVELHIHRPNNPRRLDGAGLIVVNPPWTLESALASLLPLLAVELATGPGAGHILEWLTEERVET